MGRFTEFGHEPPQGRRSEGEQTAPTGLNGERVDTGAEPVLEGVRVAVYEAQLGQRLERARDLALLAAEQSGHTHHSEAAVRGGGLVAEREQDVERKAQRSVSCNHGC